jgi:uncharacterized protein (TIGR03435 family)
MDIVLTLLLFFMPTRAASNPVQHTASVSQVYEYEISSIKPYKSGNGDVGFHYNPEGFTATNVSLPFLLQFAFGVHSDQIVGLPNSIASETFEVEARMDESVADALKKLDPEHLRSARQQMLQSLLRPL